MPGSSGPPGIGKSTAAGLVAKKHGFEVFELNASDTRSKRVLKVRHQRSPLPCSVFRVPCPMCRLLCVYVPFSLLTSSTPSTWTASPRRHDWHDSAVFQQNQAQEASHHHGRGASRRWGRGCRNCRTVLMTVWLGHVPYTMTRSRLYSVVVALCGVSCYG